MKKTPLTELEQGLAKKLCGARFPCYSAAKRFARDLEAGYIQQLSDRGRAFMAHVVHRFRRQYRLTAEEQSWVSSWLRARSMETMAGRASDTTSGVGSETEEGRDRLRSCQVPIAETAMLAKGEGCSQLSLLF